MLKRILREPLIHFLTLGVLIFVAYGAINDEPSRRPTLVIEITASTVERLSDAWTKQWRRSPTPIGLPPIWLLALIPWRKKQPRAIGVGPSKSE